MHWKTLPITLAYAPTTELYIIHAIAPTTDITLYVFRLLCHTPYVYKIDSKTGNILKILLGYILDIDSIKKMYEQTELEKIINNINKRINR